MIWLVKRADDTVLGVAKSLEEACEIAIEEEESASIESWQRPRAGDHQSVHFRRRSAFPVSICRDQQSHTIENTTVPLSLTIPPRLEN